MFTLRELLVTVSFLGICQICSCQYTTELFPDFFNLNPVDVPSLSDIPASYKCRECPRVYYPVCADDNVTYINECRMNCVNAKPNKQPKAKFIRTGPCEIFPDLK